MPGRSPRSLERSSTKQRTWSARAGLPVIFTPDGALERVHPGPVRVRDALRRLSVADPGSASSPHERSSSVVLAGLLGTMVGHRSPMGSGAPAPGAARTPRAPSSISARADRTSDNKVPTPRRDGSTGGALPSRSVVQALCVAGRRRRRCRSGPPRCSRCRFAASGVIGLAIRRTRSQRLDDVAGFEFVDSGPRACSSRASSTRSLRADEANAPAPEQPRCSRLLYSLPLRHALALGVLHGPAADCADLLLRARDAAAIAARLAYAQLDDSSAGLSSRAHARRRARPWPSISARELMGELLRPGRAAAGHDRPVAGAGPRFIG